MQTFAQWSTKNVAFLSGLSIPWAQIFAVDPTLQVASLTHHSLMKPAGKQGCKPQKLRRGRLEARGWKLLPRQASLGWGGARLHLEVCEWDGFPYLLREEGQLKYLKSDLWQKWETLGTLDLFQYLGKIDFTAPGWVKVSSHGFFNLKFVLGKRFVGRHVCLAFWKRGEGKGI